MLFRGREKGTVYYKVITNAVIVCIQCRSNLSTLLRKTQDNQDGNEGRKERKCYFSWIGLYTTLSDCHKILEK